MPFVPETNKKRGMTAEQSQLQFFPLIFILNWRSATELSQASEDNHPAPIGSPKARAMYSESRVT